MTANQGNRVCAHLRVSTADSQSSHIGQEKKNQYIPVVKPSKWEELADGIG